jgi:RNA-directed DNA polymerase
MQRFVFFQRKLYIRAKQDERFRAYSLYGKLCEDITLVEAYRRVRSNYSKGVGVDNQSFEGIEKQGVKPFLECIQKRFGKPHLPEQSREAGAHTQREEG